MSIIGAVFEDGMISVGPVGLTTADQKFVLRREKTLVVRSVAAGLRLLTNVTVGGE